MKTIALLFAVATGPVLAACPSPPNITAELDQLIANANDAKNDMAGREVSDQMWELWLKAPDPAAQEVLDKGIRANANYDFIGATEAFTRLIGYCPDYAEGYNQRAFVSFRTENFEAALVDLDKALSLSPDHVGAQSGRALTLMYLGRLAEARVQLQGALKNNPWLSERFLLSPGGPLAIEGEDI